MRTCIISLFLLYLLSHPAMLAACSCWGHPFSHLVDEADVIFQGVIVEKGEVGFVHCIPLEEGGFREYAYTEYVYRFKIRSVFKGICREFENVPGVMRSYGDCRLTGKLGDEVIVLGKRKLVPSELLPKDIALSELLHTGGCYGTGNIEYFGQSEIQYLNTRFGTNYQHPLSIYQLQTWGLISLFSLIILLLFSAYLTPKFLLS